MSQLIKTWPGKAPAHYMSVYEGEGAKIGLLKTRIGDITLLTEIRLHKLGNAGRRKTNNSMDFNLCVC